MAAAPPATPWQAMTTRPWRFLASGWPWRSLAYLACGMLAVVPLLALVRAVAVAGGGGAYLAGAAAVLVFCLVAALPLAALERWRLRLVDHTAAAVTHGHAAAPKGPRRLWVRLAERATWREFGYAVLFVTVLAPAGAAIVLFASGLLLAPAGPVLILVLDTGDLLGDGGGPDGDPLGVVLAICCWLVLLPLTAYLVAGFAAAQAALARLLLTPADAELATRMRELTRSRARLVDAFEIERSRIERDLHDGAQQRLVALTMTLGLAELKLAGAEGDVPDLVARARTEAEAVLGELRELIRGIHPRVLTDRGIEAAVLELTDRCPIPVRVGIELPRRPSRAIEAVTYFAVSEALANVVKHAGATRAEVTGRASGAGLVLTIADDGVGGAAPETGTGLQGLADRVAAVSGTLGLSSPPGGPTVLRLELPWQTPD
ncbi:sensor domain-containing protein [Amycolatopsis sp. cmx-4-61]|uniref:sensor histidine kinase n=1 Tax=Amycolatopsis sp. cmx-4-61 TaxID=2790937 RepID=UPI00397E715C